jgi:hypothetical protein
VTHEELHLIELKPGTRLRSQVCSTEIVVVRAAASPIELGCGGAPMVAAGADVASGASPAPGLDAGAMLGKRYTSTSDASLEVLVVKAGKGTLTAADTPLVFKEAKPLPASD